MYDYEHNSLLDNFSSLLLKFTLILHQILSCIDNHSMYKRLALLYHIWTG